MAIIPFEKLPLERLPRNNRLLYFLLSLLILSLLIILFVLVWKGYLFQPRTSLTDQGVSQLPEIKIDFNVLKNPILKKLRIPEEIQSFSIENKEGLGRENPFLPYTK
jgi:hypothetical protein